MAQSSGSFLLNPRTRLLLIAIALGALASLLANTYIKQNVAKAKGGQRQSVIVITTAVEEGDLIKQSDLGERSIPVEYIQPRSMDGSLAKSVVDMGAVASRSLIPGQILTPDDIVLEQRSSLSDHLSMNERAVTISVSSTNSFDNMIEPGDRVDILTLDRGGELTADGEMKVLLQNVYVLAVNDNLHRKLIVPTTGSSSKKDKSDSVNSLTLKLSFDDAIKLSYYESQGSLTFLLRNRNDIFIQGMPVYADKQHSDTDGMASVDNPLPERVEGYPTIFEEGNPVRSAYYPSERMMRDQLSSMNMSGADALKAKMIESSAPARTSAKPADNPSAKQPGQ